MASAAKGWTETVKGTYRKYTSNLNPSFVHFSEILSRATSITEALDETSKGAKFFKVRQKGGFRGLKLYCRTFKTDFNEFSITYLPNKAITGKANCVGHPGPGNPASIDIRDISEVRIGHSTDTFNALVKENNNKSSPKIGDVLCHRDNCFSIIFNVSQIFGALESYLNLYFQDDTPNLDLIAETTSIRNTWANVIQHLIVAMKSLDEEKKFKLFLKRQFKNADKDGSGCLSFEECQDLISQLNIKFPADKVKALFNEADFLENQDKGTLCEEEFIRFSYNLLNRPELRPVFLKYCIGSSSDGNARMTVEHLCQFMKEEQKYDICREEGKQLIEAFEPSADKSSLSLDGFSHFIMFSDLHHILNSKTKLVYQDMSQPMSHYWIASSHNTYLLGNQISGESSVDGYIRSLKEGCRCVELDCWDGSDGEPIIYHGWTLTTKILFKDVIKDAIAKYAFAASDFPLILSIENHCSLEQQDKMADYMRDLLGDYLFTSPPDEEASVMPSPDSLKKKILVKAKRLPPGKSPDDELVDEDSNDDEVDEKRKEKAKKISQKLSDCVNYIHAVHFPGFESEDGAEKSKYYHMSSFGENKTMSILAEADSATKFVHYNTRQISRIYPGAARQDSSNLKILPPWNAGCQIGTFTYTYIHNKCDLYFRYCIFQWH